MLIYADGDVYKGDFVDNKMHRKGFFDWGMAKPILEKGGLTENMVHISTKINICSHF